MAETMLREAYNDSIVDFAIRWARLMQRHLLLGQSFGAMADTIETRVSFGTTENQRYHAANVLARHWKYGVPFWKWYNRVER
ncbi:MAG: hypothetical protein ACREGJ_03225 [Candidatus Saccharimonadales bacterium]